MFGRIFNSTKKKKVFEDHGLLCGNTALGVTVELVGYRQFYDSQWKIKTPNFTTTITRWDGETGDNLLKLIEEVSSLTEEEIRKLDERSNIYYD